MNKKPVRLLAVECISDVLLNKRSLQQVLPKAKDLCQSKEDKALLQTLCYGVLRYYPQLQWIAQQLLTHKIKPKDLGILPVISLGLYQLLYTRIAKHAAIKETVEITKLLKKPWWTGLVNAVLRAYDRRATEILTILKSQSFLQSTHIPDLECHHLHPSWFINSVKKAWPEDWQKILLNNTVLPPFTLRINRHKVDFKTYLSQLQQNHFAVHTFEENLLKDTIIIENPCVASELPGYSEGLFSVQDGAAQLAAHLLDLQPGQSVLDACAAPGVKTTHLFEIEPSIQVTAVDISASRLNILKENCQRLQVCPTIITADVVNTAAWWDQQLYDRILLDAPCSATGVIRRHPDIKFLRSEEEINKFSNQQLKILMALWPLLKPGGKLLYATCSILPAENSEVINVFLAKHADAFFIPIECPFGISLAIGHQILPGQKNMDGFYYCLLSKYRL